MIKVLLSLFLILNSLIGLLFYEETSFGTFLKSSETYSLIFFVVNFIISNILNVIINTEFIILSYLLLSLFTLIFSLIICLGIPYYIIFELIELNDKLPFPWLIYGFSVIMSFTVVMSPIFRFILSIINQEINQFFDNLRFNLIKRSLGRDDKK